MRSTLNNSSVVRDEDLNHMSSGVQKGAIVRAPGPLVDEHRVDAGCERYAGPENSAVVDRQVLDAQRKALRLPRGRSTRWHLRLRLKRRRLERRGSERSGSGTGTGSSGFRFRFRRLGRRQVGAVGQLL